MSESPTNLRYMSISPKTIKKTKRNRRKPGDWFYYDFDDVSVPVFPIEDGIHRNIIELMAKKLAKYHIEMRYSSTTDLNLLSIFVNIGRMPKPVRLDFMLEESLDVILDMIKAKKFVFLGKFYKKDARAGAAFDITDEHIGLLRNIIGRYAEANHVYIDELHIDEEEKEIEAVNVEEK